MTKDWTQNDDMAAANPTKLKELQDLFWVEANKYQVLPLDASAFTRVVTPRPSLIAGRTEFTYVHPMTGVLPGTEPNILDKSFNITADITVPQNGGEGILVTDGGRFGGYAFYLLKGKPVFNYNLEGVARFRWEGKTVLSPGKHIITFDFKYSGPGLGKGGTGVLSVDGKEIVTQNIPSTTPFKFGVDESFDLGSDTATPVDEKANIFLCYSFNFCFSIFATSCNNAFGGYNFRDKMNFGNAYAYLNGGGIWGASIEGVNARGTGLEILYQYQSTKIPLYGIPGNTQLNAGSDGAVVSYLLFNVEQYYMNNPKIQPYFAAGLGAVFYKGDYQGSTSESKFAWDVKTGVKFNAGSGFGIKIGAQLMASPQATGTAFFWGYNGVIYPYTTYATILQFGFTGGLSYSFGGK